MSVRDWHALVALGTDGGQPLLDGDQLAAGVHLLWSVRPELGFPVGGYHVWRRDHRRPEFSCLDVDNGLFPAGGALSWEWLGFRLEASPGPVLLAPDACGELGALRLPGDQTLEARAPFQAQAVAATGTGRLPVVEVLVSSGGREAVAARTIARRVGDVNWSVEVWVDGAAGVRLTGLDLHVCLLCFGTVEEGGGWGRLTERPILLPVVDQGTQNEPAFLHDQAATQAVAEARLSATLPAPTRETLSQEFARDLGALAEQLVREGREAALPTAASDAVSARTPPRLRMPAASLVALAAVDPDISRMLGLYWHDPVAGGPWDYKVVAHHGAIRYPGRRVTFDGLQVGATWPGTLVHQGVTFVGNGRLEAVAPATPGNPPLLRVRLPRNGTVAGIHLDPPVPAVTLRLRSIFAGPFTAWHGGAQVDSGLGAFGQVVLDHAPGIDAITWTVGPVDLIELELHLGAGEVGDLVAYAWHHAAVPPDPVRDLQFTEVAAAAEPTRPHPDGTLDRATGVVGLEWSVPGAVQDVSQPVRVLVARAFRGSGEAPVPAGPFELRNAEQPALAAASSPALEGPPPGPAVPRRWTERAVPAGWYAWRLRGIDAFGRLGRWSAEREVQVAPATRPPPPDRVTARYLDPADPNLSADDRTLAEADGAGLLVEWAWLAGQRVQAPQVEPDGEFRVLLRRGDPNLLRGEVLSVHDQGEVSRLDTDLTWGGAPDALAGELLRLGGASFEVTGNGSGSGAWVEVRHLAAPTRRPTTGPCAIRLSEAGGLQADLGDPLSFDRRLHAEPVGSPLHHFSRVGGAVASGDGATVTLGDPLPAAPDGLLPGFLVTGGIVFPVTGQTPGSSRLEVPGVVQADGSIALPEAGQPCTVWGGAAYRAWLPGVRLRPSAGEALALALVAVTTSDGDPAVADEEAWSRPDRGGLGGRPGRESRTSRIARVTAPRRTPPPPVTVTLPPPEDGDIPADQAEPADWYGRARYTLTFAPSAGAAGYRVLRASTAALFTRDRVQRQSGTGPYGAGPFEDGGASEAWLAEHHPSLSVDDLTADLDSHPDSAAVLAAWRGWSAWYYPGLLNREVMALAERPGNEEAFRPAHEGMVAPPYRDTLDGRGLGRFVYRVRPVDASANAGAWSAAFPLVEVRDVTPPATPVLQSALGAENAVALVWQAGREPDLAGYRVWRAERADALADVRRRRPHAELAPTPDAALERWQDEGLVGLRDWYYRVAAVDIAGNVSAPTAVVKARPVDVLPPDPPSWVRAVRVKRRGSDGAVLPRDAPEDPADTYTPAVACEWTAAEDQVTCMLERQAEGERIFTARTGWLGPTGGPRRFVWVDDGAEEARVLTYRVRPRDAAGNEQRYAWNPVRVPPAGGAR